VTRRAVLVTGVSVVVGLALGIGATWVYLQPSQSRLQEQSSRPQASAQDAAALRGLWSAETWYLQSAEPTRPVTNGVYLAKISPVGTDTADIWADWEGTAGLWTGAVTNKSSYRQKLTLSPFGAVVVQTRPPVRAESPGPGPYQEPPLLNLEWAIFDRFFPDLSSNTATGAALRNAHWWVTVQDGRWFRLLVEARTGK
jgi:hypothetical protein